MTMTTTISHRRCRGLAASHWGPPPPPPSRLPLLLHFLRIILFLLGRLPLLLLILQREGCEGAKRRGVDNLACRCCQNRQGQECRTVRSLLCGPGSARIPGPHHQWWSLLSPWRFVLLVLHLLSRHLHHCLRALCAVVEGRRQLHGYRQPLMTVPRPEWAFPPPCEGSAFSHSDRQCFLKQCDTTKGCPERNGCWWWCVVVVVVVFVVVCFFASHRV